MEHLIGRWPPVDGKHSHQVVSRRSIFRRFQQSYGPLTVDDFGPKLLQEYRKRLVGLRHSRKYVNMQVDQLKRMFKWAVANELYSASSYQALCTVEGLRKGEEGVLESKAITVIDDAIVKKTVECLPRTVADMVRLQRLTGMRPGEVCQIRPSDVERTGDVWVYRPKSHKTESLGKVRAVPIGPRGQRILKLYLARKPDECCFSPAETFNELMTRRTAEARFHRHYKKQRNPKRPPGVQYTTVAHRRAIHRACDKAGVDRWGPHRLRHTAATEIRAKFGLEATQAALGHSNAKVTQIYAETNFQLAANVMKKIG